MKHNRLPTSFARLGSLLIIACACSPALSFSPSGWGSPLTNTVASGQKFPSSKIGTDRPEWMGRSYKTVPRGRRHAVALGADPSATNGYDPFATANKIEPETMPLPSSMAFYAKFLVKHFIQKKIDKKSQVKVEGKKRAMWQRFNEQRKNVMTLAGYTPHIVVPSFTFLFLGALMTSIVPAYYSKCIQCVATLTATKGQLMEAIVGLGVTSIFAALFTGLRGSLFWIGGTCCVGPLLINRREIV
jgi:hypothetical protein